MLEKYGLQLLLILLRYDSRMQWYQKSYWVFKPRVLWRCMALKRFWVAHVLALLILAKCPHYKTTESDPLASHPTRTSSLLSREGTQPCVLTLPKPLPLGQFVLHSEQGSPGSRASSRTKGLPHKKLLSLPLYQKEGVIFAAFSQETDWFGCNSALNCPALPREGDRGALKDAAADRWESLRWENESLPW